MLVRISTSTRAVGATNKLAVRALLSIRYLLIVLTNIWYVQLSGSDGWTYQVLEKRFC